MTGLEGRAIMEAAVRRELFGPVDEIAPWQTVDCAGGSARFDSKETARGLWHDSETGQEILTESDPLRRYGIGVLYNGAADAGDLTWVPGLPDSDETSDAPVTPAAEPRFAKMNPTQTTLTSPTPMPLSRARWRCRSSAGSRSLVRFHSRSPAPTMTAWLSTSAVTRDHGSGGSVALSSFAASVPGELLANRTRALLEIPTESEATLRVKPNAQVFSRPVPGESDPRAAARHGRGDQHGAW